MDKEKLSMDKDPSNVSEYFTLDQIIEQSKIPVRSENKLNIKIAYLSSFTTKGIKEVLNVKCHQLGIASNFFIAQYNQYMQEILNGESSLYKFHPDIIIIFIDTKSLLGDYFYFPYRFSEPDRKALIEKMSNQINNTVRILLENVKGKIIFHNFEIPVCSPMGILENKMSFGFAESIAFLNNKLREYFRHNPRVFLFDYDVFCSKHGKKNICDPKMYYLADMKLNFSYIIPLCEEYLAYIKPQLNLYRKCLILDLDNTLWGGVVGEDGLEGLKLGPTGAGKSFWEFQKYILSLHERGLILAINSHNNYSDVSEVFKKHPYMILKEEHFASIKINWDDKISNIQAIAHEINVGMDSLVFIDDDKVKREMVRDALPEVLVIDLPQDPCRYLQILSEMNVFSAFQITEEDIKKGQMYAQQRKRQELKKTRTSIADYLKGLETVVTIEKADPFNIPRITQLTQKTNQFNMTTRRYAEDCIERFSKSDKFLVVSVRVEDRIGDNGIAGAAIVEKNTNSWKIDTFLLSCRVIGRNVEEVILAYILEQAKKEKVKIVIGEFIQTKKNVPAAGFYKKNNFTLVKNESGIECWEYDVTKDYPYPQFIKIRRRN